MANQETVQHALYVGLIDCTTCEAGKFFKISVRFIDILIALVESKMRLSNSKWEVTNSLLIL